MIETDREEIHGKLNILYFRNGDKWKIEVLQILGRCQQIDKVDDEERAQTGLE